MPHTSGLSTVPYSLYLRPALDCFRPHLLCYKDGGGGGEGAKILSKIFKEKLHATLGCNLLLFSLSLLSLPYGDYHFNAPTTLYKPASKPLKINR